VPNNGRVSRQESVENHHSEGKQHDLNFASAVQENSKSVINSHKSGTKVRKRPEINGKFVLSF
jgi:hypothetical protein